MAETVLGEKQLIAAFRELPIALRKTLLRKVTRTVCKQDVLPLAQRYVPVQFGDLQDSLTVRAAKKTGRDNVGAEVTTREGMFSGETFYGGYIEFGWFHWKDQSFVPGESFLRRALYQDRESKLATFANEVKQGLPEVVKTVARKTDADKLNAKVARRQMMADAKANRTAARFLR